MPKKCRAEVDGVSASLMRNRLLARHGLQQLIELEVAAVIGADRHERTEQRLGHRNGYRSRSLTTQVGDIDLLIPIDRRSSACDKCEPAAYCLRYSSPVAGWTRPSSP